MRKANFSSTTLQRSLTIENWVNPKIHSSRCKNHFFCLSNLQTMRCHVSKKGHLPSLTPTLDSHFEHVLINEFWLWTHNWRPHTLRINIICLFYNNSNYKKRFVTLVLERTVLILHFSSVCACIDAWVHMQNTLRMLHLCDTFCITVSWLKFNKCWCILHNFDSQGHQGLKLLVIRSKSVHLSHDGTWTRSLRISSLCCRSPTRYHCATRDWLLTCNYTVTFNSKVRISELTFGIVLCLGICYLWCHLTMRTPRNRTYNSNRIKLCDVFMRFEKYITLARSRLIFLSLCGVMRIISLLWLDI